MNIDLLIHYITRETTPAEDITVEHWCKQDISNRKELDNLRMVWEMTARDKDGAIEDTAESLLRFKQKLAAKQETIMVPIRRKYFWGYWIKVAAVFIGIPMMVWFYIIQVRTNPDLVASTINKTKTLVLTDGSVVVLNRNSNLKYPESFSGNNRIVNLNKGEAFFKISHDSKKPFYVLANGIKIRVVGTAFNVKVKDKLTEVIVEAGKVSVSNNKQQILLKPQESIVVSAANSHLYKEKHTDLLYNYYRSKEFVANGTPLYKLAQVLEEAYDVHVSFDTEKIKYLPMSTTFKDESLDDILNVIARTFNLKVEKNGTHILLKIANNQI